MNVFREVLSNMSNNKGGCCITVGTITISLVILGVFLLLFVNLKNLAIGLSDNISLVVYLNDTIPEGVERNIGKFLRSRKEIKQVDFISKEDALRSLKNDLGGDSVILEGLEKNLLPSSFKVTMKGEYSTTTHLDSMAISLQKQKGVESVDYGKEWLEKFETVITFSKTVIIGVGLLLYSGLLLIISNTVTLSLYSNSKEIRIMKLVGATDWYIQKPFILEGIVEGFLGAVFSLIWLLFFYKVFLLKLDNMIHTVLLGYSVTFIPVTMMGGIVGSGVIVGWLGSMISLRKCLQDT